MIPISSNQVLKVPEPKSGATLHLRYVTGEQLDRFMALQGQSNSLEMQKYRKQAEDNVRKQTHGLKRNAQLKVVAEEMARLAAADGVKSDDGFARAREIVDLCLCGWDCKAWPEFPAPPARVSSMFVIADLLELADMITAHIGELTGISVDEAKN